MLAWAADAQPGTPKKYRGIHSSHFHFIFKGSVSQPPFQWNKRAPRKIDYKFQNLFRYELYNQLRNKNICETKTRANFYSKMMARDPCYHLKTEQDNHVQIPF
jgi:hypothetical protein